MINNLTLEDKSEIEKALDNFALVWNQKDAEGLVNLFVSDCEFIDIMGQLALGKPNIQKMHAMVFQKMMKEAILQLDILYARAIAKGLALVTGKWSTKGHTDPQNNKLLERAGIIEVVLEKDEGEWKLKMVQNFDFTGMYNNPKAYAIKTLSPTV